MCETRNEITRRQRKSSRSSNNNKSSSFKWTAKGLSYSYTSIGYTPISNKKFFFFFKRTLLSQLITLEYRA